MRCLRLALLPLLLVACTEQAPVAPIEDGPAFNFSNGPDNPGGVFRSTLDDWWWVAFGDVDTHLFAIYSNDPEGFCGPGTSEKQPVHFQVAADEWNVVIHSEDWYAWVYDETGVNPWAYPGGPCAWIADTDPLLASGRVQFKSVWAGNKGDWNANGTLDRADGLGTVQARLRISEEWSRKTGEWLGYTDWVVVLGPDPRN
jgi:hypothetical protein